MNLSRSQVSLVITSLFMSLVVVLLFTVHLGGVKEEQQGIEISLIEEMVAEKIEKKKKNLTNPTSVKSHRAFNETAKPKPLKTPEKLREERIVHNDPEEFPNSDFMNRLRQLATKREERKKRLAEQTAPKETVTDPLTDKRTSVSYALADRNAYSLPPPIYTCIEGGKVVITINVDAKGYVTKATFNVKSSETRNRCLIDNAIEYALRARFSPNSQKTQTGTITYLFQGK